MTKSHAKHKKHTEHHAHHGDGASHTAHHHKPTPKKSGVGKSFWQATTVLFAVLFVLSIFTTGFSTGFGDGEIKVKEESQRQETMATVDNPLPVELYVMSQCPYGVQAEDTMFAAIQELGEEYFDLQVDYISTDLGNGQFRSLHGEPETQGNIVQLCAKESNPEAFLDFVLCMNENPQGIPGNWESCSNELDLNTAKIQECYEGPRGVELLSESAARTSAAGATGSPTIYVNDLSYSGGRGVNDFKRAFCNAFEQDKPAACAAIPEPVRVDMIVLNDERCAECMAAQQSLAGQLVGVFPGLAVESIDYMTDEGKELYDAIGGGALPAMLFTADVEEAEGYANVERFLQPAGDYLSLLIGASFDPTKEICDNNIDDTGNGQVDCADSDCDDSMVCRETIDNQLQVFIMSDCPYGRQAVEALKEVDENFANGDLDFEIHYIASEQGDDFSSLHGQYEVDENIIQLCALEHSPDVWFDYVYCRSTNGVRGVDWKTCAESTGVDINAVQACFDGDQGAELLREDIKIANSLGISASPTWLANNKYTFSGIDAETVKSNFCRYNQDTTGCENTLSTDTGNVAAGGTC